MARGGTWLVAGVASVAFHAAGLGALALSLRPDEIEQQRPPPTELELAAEPVRRSRASEAETEPESAEGQVAETIPLSQDAPRRTRADPASPVTNMHRPIDANPVNLSQSEASGVTASAAHPVGREMPTSDLTTSKAAPLRAEPQSAREQVQAPQKARQGTLAAGRPQPVTAQTSAPTALTAAPVEVSPREPSAPKGNVVTDVGSTLTAMAPKSSTALPHIPKAEIASTQAPTLQTAAARPPRASSAAQITTNSKRLETGRISGVARPAASTPAAGPAQPELHPAAFAASGLPAFGDPTAPVTPEAWTGQRLAPDAQSAAETPSASVAPRQTATLAWQAGDENDADPVSLTAFQAFMSPEALPDSEGKRVRDGLEALLADIPCARLQTEFLPDTATLELRGHIPEDGLRQPLLAALQEQMGASIRVSDAMQLLPSPQCGAVAGIAAVGLPQSEEQNTNAMVLGENAHVREFSFQEGQFLELEFYAPEYEAVVYIDYFDASGNVIHLQPNEILPARSVAADSFLTWNMKGIDPNADRWRIGPPFDREIVVAFAASTPLYDGLRPIVEPAESYLGFLEEQVALARSDSEDFKGEWVYFIVSTGPKR